MDSEKGENPVAYEDKFACGEIVLEGEPESSEMCGSGSSSKPVEGLMTLPPPPSSGIPLFDQSKMGFNERAWNDPPPLLMSGSSNCVTKPSGRKLTSRVAFPMDSKLYPSGGGSSSADTNAGLKLNPNAPPPTGGFVATGQSPPPSYGGFASGIAPPPMGGFVASGLPPPPPPPIIPPSSNAANSSEIQ